jgi:hypothetical protein
MREATLAEQARAAREEIGRLAGALARAQQEREREREHAAAPGGEAQLAAVMRDLEARPCQAFQTIFKAAVATCSGH